MNRAARWSVSRPSRWQIRLGVVVSAVVVVSASACTMSPTPGVAPPSTFGASSPWLGSFSSVTLPPPVNSLTALDCASAARCWATGSTVGVSGAPNGAAVITTTDGAARWAAQVIPPTVGYLSGISCSDGRRCTAVGQAAPASSGQQGAIIVTTDGGAVWTPVSTPPGVLDVTAVSCRSDQRCVAIGATAGGDVALVSTSAGTAWTQQGPLPATMSGATDISCPDDDSCWVTAHTAIDPDHVAGTVAVTTDGGTTWSAAVTPPGLGVLSGISCLVGPPTGSGAFPTTSVPAPAAAPPASTPTPAAASTTSPPPVGSTTSTVPVVGVAGVRCTAVGTTATSLDAPRSGHGVILTSDNGGATWADQTVTPGAASLTAVSCIGVGSCVVVGSSPSSSPQAGLVILTGSEKLPWQRPAVVGSPQPLTAVSCRSSSRCVAVGESIIEYLTGG